MGTYVRAVIEPSGRHIHLSQQDAEALFGSDFKLTMRHKLGESDQFLSTSKVTLVGPDGKSMITSVLGPYRKETQVELSYTEARAIGIRPTLADSGQLDGTIGIKLVGDQGEVTLTRGVMVARRHVHMPPADAETLGIYDKDMVVLKVDGPRGLVFQQMIARIAPSNRNTTYSNVHLDYDEWNSAGLEGTSAEGKIYKTIQDIED